MPSNHSYLPDARFSDSRRGAGELTVSRALGDFHLAQLKFRNDGGSFAGPLTAEPEVRPALDQGHPSVSFKLSYINLRGNTSVCSGRESALHEVIRWQGNGTGSFALQMRT